MAKAKKKPEGYTVIADTREQQPYDFAAGKNCAYIMDTALETGDYSLEGLEDILTIERKMSVSEIAGNLTTDRFKRELERMESFKYKYILCEFSWSDVHGYPYADRTLPAYVKKKIRVKGNFLKGLLMDVTINHDIPIIYAGNRKNAEQYCIMLLERIWRLEN